MAIWSDWILPRLIDRTLGTRTHDRLRQALVSQARGRVVELGFGSGRNLPFYDPETVSEVLAVEPVAAGFELAQGRIAASAIPVRPLLLDGARLPLASGSVDTVVSTWTLCTIPELQGALREARRVLRPGGRLLFLEHGLSPEAQVARWQRRIDPVWGVFSGGCHLSRDIPGELRAAGLELEALEAFDMEGPAVASHTFRGVALP